MCVIPLSGPQKRHNEGQASPSSRASRERAKGRRDCRSDEDFSGFRLSLSQSL